MDDAVGSDVDRHPDWSDPGVNEPVIRGSKDDTNKPFHRKIEVASDLRENGDNVLYVGNLRQKMKDLAVNRSDDGKIWQWEVVSKQDSQRESC